MVQAKGILPRGDDREVLYRNPRTCGYFVGVKLSPGLDRPAAEQWLARVDSLVDSLVSREDPKEGEEKGTKVAAVAVGLAPSFFTLNGEPRWSPAVEPPAGFPVNSVPSPLRSGLLQQVTPVGVDVLFYVASVYEARVKLFLAGLSQSPEVERIMLERGYQRLDETEHFGYRDGVRNVMPRTERPEVTFVHRDGLELDEPAWADGGSYMAYLKIRQDLAAFGQQTSEAQDMLVGRKRDGTRLDLADQGIDPDDEPADVPNALPPSSHVRKVGPRGTHDDTQIFRRGLPYLEITPEGKLEVGLQFCSFQATLDQFDVVFNDWCLETNFPVQGAGPDALLDPARGLTQVLHAGFFFVPPYQPGGLTAAVFAQPQPGRTPKTGRLVVHKRVVDPTDPNRRFERHGFTFQLFDAQDQPVGAPFSTDSTGRGIFDGVLIIGDTYTLRETSSPVPNVAPVTQTFVMDKANRQLPVENTVTVPNGPYGSPTSL
jgi:deferrochelatase/peroxidase EfeB